MSRLNRYARKAHLLAFQSTRNAAKAHQTKLCIQEMTNERLSHLWNSGLSSYVAWCVIALWLEVSSHLLRHC